VGVGAADEGGMVDHVLGRFSAGDIKLMKEAEERAADAVLCILEDGADRAMNVYNTKPDKGKGRGREGRRPCRR